VRAQVERCIYPERKKGDFSMKSGIILAGAVFTCGAFLPVIATQAAAAPPGAIVVADNDHHDKNPPPKAPGGAAHGQSQGHMGGNPMAGHNNAMGGNPMGGHNAMGGNPMGGHNAMAGHGSHGNFDRHAFQRNVTASRHFHVGGYNRPQGWYDHHWGYGDILPALFWAQTYWLNDYYDYGLEAPPPGFVWVRDGNDALLVDTSTGEVLQADYGVFD
jgi:Ni/Co efflux regulator RcnB